MPFRNGSVTIDVPAAGASVVVGATFRAVGGTEPRMFTKLNGTVEDEIPPTSVTVSFDGGAPESATVLTADWSEWEASLRAATPGPHTILAVAHWSGYRAEDRVTVTAIESPLTLDEPAGAVGTVDFPVVVSAGHPNGIIAGSVRIRADAQGWVTLSPAGDRWTGRLSLNSDRVPPGGRQVPVDLQATSGDGSLHERTVQITAADATVPVVLTYTPADGAKLPGTAVGAATDVVINAQDPGQGQLTSGVAAATCAGERPTAIASR